MTRWWLLEVAAVGVGCGGCGGNGCWLSRGGGGGCWLSRGGETGAEIGGSTAKVNCLKI